MTMTIYGQDVEVINAPTFVNPRFQGAIPKRSSAPVQLRTYHTLSRYLKDDYERINPCPFENGVEILDDRCCKCEFNMRKKYISVLPAWSVECGLFDARKRLARGDYREYKMLAVVADLPTLRLMEDYVKEHFTSNGRKGRIQK